MMVLKAGLDPDVFFARAGRALIRALLLDYDGTLAPFTAERDRAVPYPGVAGALGRLQGVKDHRLVIVSGRTAEEVQGLLGLTPPPEIWGVHGWERMMPDGTTRAADVGVRAKEGLCEALSWARKTLPTGSIEAKSASVAFHWRGRGAGEAARIQKAVCEEMGPVARGSGLEIHEFDGGLELRVPGYDKGTVVNTIYSEMGPGLVAAYLGDDLTDEDAFVSVKGRGLGVLVRGERRETAADIWLKPPEELLWFIGRWTDACTGG